MYDTLSGYEPISSSIDVVRPIVMDAYVVSFLIQGMGCVSLLERFVILFSAFQNQELE